MVFKLRLGGVRKKPKKPKAFLVDRLYLPKHLVDKKLARKYYDKRVFDQKRCNGCQVFKDGDRFCDICSQCEHYKGRFTTFEETEINNKEYLAFPSGSIQAVAKNLGIDLEEFDILDNRCDARCEHPLTYTGKLFTGKEIINGYPVANQVGIVKQFAPHKRGLIRSPPRTGKTVLATFIYCGAKRKTIYLVHEKQLAKQFYRTILKFTDLRKQRELSGKKIAGIIQKESDWFEDWDLVICNYQKFISDSGSERVRKFLVKRFGQLMVDECHRAAARGYMTLVNRLDCKRKIGFSATLTRKDGMHFLMHQMLGDVVAEGEVKMRPPVAEIINTGIYNKQRWNGRAGYTYANLWLAKQKDRTKLIIKNVFQDLRENPDHSIVIPVIFKKQAAQLARMINAQAQFNNDHKGERRPLITAHPYYQDRSINRTEILDKARSGEIRVIIAIRKMVKEGIDVSKWTHMYMIFPMNNAEDFYQMSQRICSVYEGKPQSVLKFFVDNMGLSINCFRSTYYNGVKKQGYTVSPENEEKATALIESLNKRKVENIDGW
jgi:superfamily II DNA or RNA helicase